MTNWIEDYIVELRKDADKRDWSNPTEYYYAKAERTCADQLETRLKKYGFLPDMPEIHTAGYEGN
jgi:hypothetical protein